MDERRRLIRTAIHRVHNVQGTEVILRLAAKITGAEGKTRSPCRFVITGGYAQSQPFYYGPPDIFSFAPTLEHETS